MGGERQIVPSPVSPRRMQLFPQVYKKLDCDWESRESSEITRDEITFFIKWAVDILEPFVKSLEASGGRSIYDPDGLFKKRGAPKTKDHMDTFLQVKHIVAGLLKTPMLHQLPQPRETEEMKLRMDSLTAESKILKDTIDVRTNSMSFLY